MLPRRLNRSSVCVGRHSFYKEMNWNKLVYLNLIDNLCKQHTLFFSNLSYGRADFLRKVNLLQIFIFYKIWQILYPTHGIHRWQYFSKAIIRIYIFFHIVFHCLLGLVGTFLWFCAKYINSERLTDDLRYILHNTAKNGRPVSKQEKNPVQKNRKKRPLVGTWYLPTEGKKNH